MYLNRCSMYICICNGVFKCHVFIHMLMLNIESWCFESYASQNDLYLLIHVIHINNVRHTTTFNERKYIFSLCAFHYLDSLSNSDQSLTLPAFSFSPYHPAVYPTVPLTFVETDIHLCEME